MPFQVFRTALNGNTFLHLSDNNHSSGITIIPEAGALLHKFIIPVNGQPFNIIENYPADKPVNEQVSFYFRSAKCSPWPCRLAGGSYNFQGQHLQVQRLFTDGSALHGLLFDQAFEVAEEWVDDDSASVLLTHNYNGYDPGYPFHFRCEAQYTLYGGGLLKVETTITNLHSTDIPIADGWHPYFELGGLVNDWQLYINAQSLVEFDDKLIPTGKTIPFDQFKQPEAIGQTRLDNCFLLSPGASPACTLYNPHNQVKVSFLPDASYPYLQVFIPDHRESIAIENISAAPDCFNNGMGLLILPPGQSTSFRTFYKAETVTGQG